ncbi:MAG TPA: Xaa-Pro peptidase family protein [Eubacteriales bacterium]|nr:Xaa-Pro peptidase family protein [Eubacteriales bacterium]
MEYNYEARLGKLQTYLQEQKLDAFIISTQDSIFYLSGASYKPIERPFFIIVRPAGKYDLVVPRLEYEHMQKVKRYGEIRSYFEYPSVEGQNWYDVLNGMLGPNARVGIEPGFSVAMHSLLNVKETVVSDAVLQLRMVKDPQEIEAIRRASEWTDLGMKKLHRSLYRGFSVVESVMPARKLQTGVIKSGEYDYLNSGFLTAGWPAPKSAQPHSVPDFHARMGSGPIVLMSYNRVNGYAAECERTVFLGDPSEKELALYNLVMRARDLAFSMVRPGVRCSDIDRATQELFASAGYKDHIIHRTGHGIGLGNHEQPWLSMGSSDVLAENMVVSIEPALYFDDIGGFRHSDTVLVTKDGYEILTKYPSDLAHLIVRRKNLAGKLKGALVRKAIRF